MTVQTRLKVESLEDRTVPTLFGTPWINPERLTISFAADGTDVAGQQNVLNSTFNQAFGSFDWKREILRAFQTWAAQTNVNVSVVADNGAPLGTPGAPQGDTRFGDIRIVGRATDRNELVESVPFQWAAGTWSGDVVFNTRFKFNRGGKQSGTYDLFTAALHEAGNVFGLRDNLDTTSVMYGTYNGAKTVPSAADISSLQAIYGTRRADAYEGTGGNNSFSTARSMALYNGLFNTTDSVIDAGLTTGSDVDFYRLRTGSNQGSTTIRLRTNGLSSLVARVDVYNASQKLIGSVSASNPTTGDLSVTLGSLTANTDYFIRVTAAGSAPYNAGRYLLTATTDATRVVAQPVADYWDLISGITMPETSLWNNDTVSRATPIASAFQLGDARFDYVQNGTLGSATDVDHFSFNAPAVIDGSNNVATISVWGTGGAAPDVRVQLLDANGALLNTETVFHGDTGWTIQFANMVAGQRYVVRLDGTPNAAVRTGTYTLGIDFGSQRAAYWNAADTTLNQSASEGSIVLSVQQNTLFQFRGTLDNLGVNSRAGARVTVFDSAGRAVMTSVVEAGAPRTFNAFLQTGNYRVVVVAANADGSVLNNVRFRLDYGFLDDNIDPVIIPGSGGKLGSTTTSSTTTSTTTIRPFSFGGYTTTTTVSATDPYADPYWY
jgi:hypothetical protein